MRLWYFPPEMLTDSREASWQPNVEKMDDDQLRDFLGNIL